MDRAMWIMFAALSLFMFLVAGSSGQTQLTDEITVETPTSAAPAPKLPKLPLAIHYEALCPDSIFFVRRRLRDALLDNDWWPRTELKLYPFGKAAFYNNTEIGELQLFCQHGSEECELNALHACALEHLELRKAFDLIYCMLRSYTNNIDACAAHLSLDVTAAKECKRTRKTPEILLPYGQATLALGISFVPTIVFDNHFEPYEQSSLRYNFEAHFCSEYKRKFHIKLPTCG